MKNLLVILIAILFLSCDGMHFRKVETRSLGSYNIKDVKKQGLFELLKLYNESDKKKENYEVYYKKSFAWNWNPSSGNLFYSGDLCGWGWVYSNVTLDKLRAEVANRENYLETDLIYKEYNKAFTLVEDNEIYAKTIRQYLCTNICNSGRDKF